MRYILPIILLFAVFICGCGKTDHENRVVRSPGVYVEGDKRIDVLSSDDVLVRVNGKSYTKREWATYLRMYGKLLNYVATGRAATSTDKKILRALSAHCMSPVNTFINTELFRAEAARLGITITDAEFERIKQANLVAFNKGGDKKARGIKAQVKSFRQFVGFFTEEEGDTLEWMLNGNAYIRKVVEAIGKERVGVSSNDYATVTNGYQELQARLDVSNDVARATLEKLSVTARGGADFADLAFKHAEINPEQGGAWGWFQKSEFTDDALKKWLDTAKVGDVSDPADLDDGVAIVKLYEKRLADNEMVDHDLPAGEKRLIPFEYRLGRLTLKAYDAPRTPSAREIVSDLMKYKHEKVEYEIGTNLWANAVIEYPNGTNWFAVAVSPQEDEKK